MKTEEHRRITKKTVHRILDAARRGQEPGPTNLVLLQALAVHPPEDAYEPEKGRTDG